MAIPAKTHCPWSVRIAMTASCSQCGGELDLPTEGQLLGAACTVLQERTGHLVVLDLSGPPVHRLARLLRTRHDVPRGRDLGAGGARGCRRQQAAAAPVGPARAASDLRLGRWRTSDPASYPPSAACPLPKEPPADTERLGA